MEVTEKVSKCSIVGEARISTVSLEDNLIAFGYSSNRTTFETMIFGGEYDMWQERYTHKRVALMEHEKIVERLSQGLPPEDEDAE